MAIRMLQGKSLAVLCLALLTVASPCAFSASNAAAPRFNMLVLAQLKQEGTDIDEVHRPFVEAFTPWLNKLAVDSNFTVTYLTSPNTLTDAVLSNVDVIWQMNDVPFGWNTTAQAAFQKYIESGKGGWVGDHHAGLYGLKPPNNQSEPLWTWYKGFLGGVTYQNYIAGFAEATVRLEDTASPILQGVGKSFVVKKDEWYTWDKSPRLDTQHIHVLANVDEASYKPASNIKMGGDHPVIWSNTSFKSRCVYIFVGHDTTLIRNPDYTTLIRNALMWAANKPATTAATKPLDKPLEKPAVDFKLHAVADRQSISLTAGGEKILSVTVLDASGHSLFHADGAQAAGRIDRSGWGAGAYLIRATTAKGQGSQWLDLQ